MRQVSTAELIDLGQRFGIDVGQSEADEIQEKVNDLLDPIDAVYDVPVERGGGGGERTWSEPDDDPLNAVVVECDVAPSGSGPLDDMTAGVKDIIAVAGVPMSCASDVMRGYVPGSDAAVVERLRDAGARITAMTNADEFAGIGFGTTSAHGTIRNPRNPDHSTGGSSGGSAAAVATNRVDVALGTDTGGSVRIPAALCGIVGLKPTYGLVPLHGVVENTYSQDHVGAMTADIEDAARVLQAIAGKDDRDPASLQAAGRDSYRVGNYLAAVRDSPDLDDLRLGLIAEGFGEGVSDHVEALTESALDDLEDAGATVERVSIDGFRESPQVKNALSLSGLAAHWRSGGAPLRRGGVVDEGYQTTFARQSRQASGELNGSYRAKMLAGAQLIEAHGGRHYTRAQLVRETLRDAFDDVLATVDALCLPTMPDVAPHLDNAETPGFIYGRNTRIANLTRLPAITMPNGAHDGLPVGFQLFGGAFGEEELLGVAAAVEPLLADVPEPVTP